MMSVFGGSSFWVIWVNWKEYQMISTRSTKSTKTGWTVREKVQMFSFDYRLKSPWVPGLILNASGFEAEHYKKDWRKKGTPSIVEVPLIWILWFVVKLTPQGFDFCFELPYLIVKSSDAHKKHRTGTRSSGRSFGQAAVLNRYSVCPLALQPVSF